MPELPEVETIRRQLEGALVGQSIRAIDIVAPKSFQGNPELIIGSIIVGIGRRGKHLIFKFENGCGMLIHLKMSGQMIICRDDPADCLNDGDDPSGRLYDQNEKYTRVKFKISNGQELLFNDMRRFGFVRVLDQNQMQTLEEDLGLGVEPLEDDFTADHLSKLLKKKPKSLIKPFLLDQSNIAGIGNIYADEALFAAMIAPDRQAGDLSAGEIANLAEVIQEVLEKSLKLGGSSMRMYVQTDGSRGSFLDQANVYGKEGFLCSRCNEAKIIRLKIAGRSSHFCPVCQR